MHLYYNTLGQEYVDATMRRASLHASTVDYYGTTYSGVAYELLSLELTPNQPIASLPPLLSTCNRRMGYSLDVHLHKDTFVNGEVVSGYVTLELSTALTVTGVIKMRVAGFERALFYIPPNTDSHFSMPFYCIENVIWSPKINEQGMSPIPPAHYHIPQA